MTKNEIRDGGSREIPVKKVSEFSVSNDKLLQQRMAKKAYELYECRGCGHGRDLEDWLEAERLVLDEIALQSQPERGMDCRQRGLLWIGNRKAHFQQMRR